MTREQLAHSVGRRLIEAEATLDRALAAAAELAAILPTARERAGLSAVVGQKVFDQVGQTLSQIVAARASLVATHRALDAVGRSLGFDDPAIGPLDKPEEDGPREGQGLAA